MIQYLIVLLSVIIPIIGGFSIRHFPMWKTRDVSSRFITVYFIVYALYFFTASTIAFHLWEADSSAMMIFRAVVTLPNAITPYFIFRKRFWQNTFLFAIAYLYGTVSVGTGNHVAINWFADNLLLATSLVNLGVLAVTLPPLLYMIRRLFSNPNMKQAVMFWRFFWLVPTVFFITIMVTSSYFNGGITSRGALIVRVLAYAALLLICYLFDIAVKQIAAAETAKRKAEESEAKADFYRRMAHEILTPLTRVSTNVQVVNMENETRHEKLTKAQGDIMLIADMVNNALDESEGNTSASGGAK